MLDVDDWGGFGAKALRTELLAELLDFNNYPSSSKTPEVKSGFQVSEIQ